MLNGRVNRINYTYQLFAVDFDNNLELDLKCYPTKKDAMADRIIAEQMFKPDIEISLIELETGKRIF